MEEKVKVPVYGDCRVVRDGEDTYVEIVDEIMWLLGDDENAELEKRLVPLITDWNSVFLPRHTMAIIELRKPLDEDIDLFAFKLEDSLAGLYRKESVTISGKNIVYIEEYVRDHQGIAKYLMCVPSHKIVLASELLDLIEHGSVQPKSLAPFELTYFIPYHRGHPLLVAKDTFKYIIMIKGDLKKSP